MTGERAFWAGAPIASKLAPVEAEALDGKNDQVAELEKQVAQLERANAELRSANAALARTHLGKRDAAAASVLIRLQQAEARADKVERSISYRLMAPLRLFKPLFQALAPAIYEFGAKVRAKLGR